MVENDLFREKLIFYVFFEFLIYPMWGKKKKFLIGVLVKKWRQRQKKGLLVKLGQNFNILSANYCYSYLFFQVMKNKKKKKFVPTHFRGISAPTQIS